MGKKLTEKESENKMILKAINRIKNIEKYYGINITRLACQRYSSEQREKIKLKSEIKAKEEELKKLREEK